MVLADIDAHIVERLERITLGASSIPVLSHIPYRDKGTFQSPCVGFQRSGMRLDTAERRSCENVFIPADTQETIDIQADLGGGTESGPTTYTRKRYPTPHILTYEIHVVATSTEQADLLVQMFDEAIPPDHSFVLGNQTPLFVRGDPINLDDLTMPEFRTAYILEIRPVWIDRLEAWDNPPIQTINFDIDA